MTAGFSRAQLSHRSTCTPKATPSQGLKKPYTGNPDTAPALYTSSGISDRGFISTTPPACLPPTQTPLFSISYFPQVFFFLPLPFLFLSFVLLLPISKTYLRVGPPGPSPEMRPVLNTLSTELFLKVRGGLNFPLIASGIRLIRPIYSTMAMRGCIIYIIARPRVIHNRGGE